MASWTVGVGAAAAAGLERVGALGCGAAADAPGVLPAALCAALRAPVACELPLGCLLLAGAAALLAVALLLRRAAAARPVFILDFAVFNPPSR